MPRKVERPGVDVYLDAHELGSHAHVGVLRRHGDLPASFEYATEWLESKQRFMLDPRLALWTGEQYPPTALAGFGIFLDSAPDRWGRVLMERREALVSRRERRAMRALHEIDFLLGVHDLTRTGALRFRATSGGPYLDNSSNAAPPITSLPELATIVRRIEEPGASELPEYERWLAMLIAPGTSLGDIRREGWSARAGRRRRDRRALSTHEIASERDHQAATRGNRSMGARSAPSRHCCGRAATDEAGLPGLIRSALRSGRSRSNR